jgi:hypothetical protein
VDIKIKMGITGFLLGFSVAISLGAIVLGHQIVVSGEELARSRAEYARLGEDYTRVTDRAQILESGLRRREEIDARIDTYIGAVKTGLERLSDTNRGAIATIRETIAVVREIRAATAVLENELFYHRNNRSSRDSSSGGKTADPSKTSLTSE